MNVDTLSIARDLKAAELPSEQAEAIAAAIGRTVSEASASKADVDSLRASLELKVEVVRTEIERMRNQIFVAMIGSQVALAGLIVALVKL